MRQQVHRIGALASAAIMATGVSACSSSNEAAPAGDGRSLAATPERSVEGKPVHVYHDLRAQARASDYVVRARVESVKPGRVAGDLPEEKIYFRNVTLEVLETLKGPVDPHHLVFEEEGWDADGTGYVVDGVQWSKPGEEAWYFLAEGADGILRLTSEYGRFSLSGGVRRGPSGLEPRAEGPWRRLAGEDDPRSAVLDAIGARS